ncbi:hypothetical protein IQ259_16050 [Fortiea sp. LEGE XX443]|uniref:hypothetical protein n=1 Tax=Fortiea sp. LEGE XX443 TaxID=1828611 RepID=UPI0018802833|nr:hypothetical protein [Fortiea sp. LEGE XX443]MBE9006536.1 hypothetical protein [Fortiea sp. LEGE XX443]
MVDIPHAVVTYILNFMIEERSLAYLFVSKDGCLLAWGGKLTEYGITNLCKGAQIGEQIFFLEGLLPLDDSSVFLPFIKTETGICADIHIFASEEGDWVLLLDSIVDEQHLSVMQQEINHASLLQEKSTKLVNQQPRE